MSLRFYVDPITEDLHIHNHGVHEEEVDEVLSHAGEDRAGREGSRTAIGQTSGERFLRAYRRRLRRRSKR